jgi:hypothetical protein
MKFSKKQLEKAADQIRLLSWAQGAIITSSSGLHWLLNGYVMTLIVLLFFGLQFFALYIDKWSEK